MKLVCPGFHGHIKKPAAGLAKFRGVVAGLDRHFLNRVRIRHVLHDGERNGMVGVVQTLDAVPGCVGRRAIHDHVEVGEIADTGDQHGGVERIPNSIAAAFAVPIPRMGSSSSCESVMLCVMSPLSVLRSVASAVTVTDSLAEPTSRAKSSGRTCPASTESPPRVSFLKPGAVTMTL